MPQYPGNTVEIRLHDAINHAIVANAPNEPEGIRLRRETETKPKKHITSRAQNGAAFSTILTHIPFEDAW